MPHDTSKRPPPCLLMPPHVSSSPLQILVVLISSASPPSSYPYLPSHSRGHAGDVGISPGQLSNRHHVFHELSHLIKLAR